VQLTFTVVTAHCNMLNAYEDEWMHSRRSIMHTLLTSGWHGNYGAKVCDRGGGQIWPKKV